MQRMCGRCAVGVANKEVKVDSSRPQIFFSTLLPSPMI